VIPELRERIPESWELRTRKRPKGKTLVDLLIDLRAPDGNKATLVIMAKGPVEPRDVPGVAQQLQQAASTLANAYCMVVAPFIGSRAQEKLRRVGVGYWDTTGNAHIALDQPVLVIGLGGADRNPWPESRALQSLRGRAAGRVARALCDFKPPYGIRELAGRAGVSPASLSRVIELLGREAIIERTSGRGPIKDVDWPALIMRWTDDYAFATSNRIATYLEPRGRKLLLDKLTTLTSPYAVTGSLAADALGAAVSAPRLMTIYVEEMMVAAEDLALRQADTGGNVILAEPFGPVAMDRLIKIDGIAYAGPSQVAADLLTGPGRSPADGEALVSWMKDNEDAWRS
jgi:hypothetical protein